MHFDQPGVYVWHCHILSHEDNEMMLKFCVGEKSIDCPLELFAAKVEMSASPGYSNWAPRSYFLKCAFSLVLTFLF
jgi:hypothetical protein